MINVILFTTLAAVATPAGTAKEDLYNDDKLLTAEEVVTYVTEQRDDLDQTLRNFIQSLGYLDAVSWDIISGKPATFAPAAHTQAISTITGLQGALAGKQPKGNYLTTEADPTIKAWAKAASKPSYSIGEIKGGATASFIANLNSGDGVIQFAPQDQVVQMGNGADGALIQISRYANPDDKQMQAGAILMGDRTQLLLAQGASALMMRDGLSDLTTYRDQPGVSSLATIAALKAYSQPKGGYLTKEVDPTIKAWAKAATKPSYSIGEIAGLQGSIDGKAGTEWLKNGGLVLYPAKYYWALAKNTGTNIAGGFAVRSSTNQTFDYSALELDKIDYKVGDNHTFYHLDPTQPTAIARKSDLDARTTHTVDNKKCVIAYDDNLQTLVLKEVK